MLAVVKVTFIATETARGMVFGIEHKTLNKLIRNSSGLCSLDSVSHTLSICDHIGVNAHQIMSG